MAVGPTIFPTTPRCTIYCRPRLHFSHKNYPMIDNNGLAIPVVSLHLDFSLFLNSWNVLNYIFIYPLKRQDVRM